MAVSALMKEVKPLEDGHFVDQRSQSLVVPHGLAPPSWIGWRNTTHRVKRQNYSLLISSNPRNKHAFYRADLLDERARLMTQQFGFSSLDSNNLI